MDNILEPRREASHDVALELPAVSTSVCGSSVNAANHRNGLTIFMLMNLKNSLLKIKTRRSREQ
jgi:hypothetical protein